MLDTWCLLLVYFVDLWSARHAWHQILTFYCNVNFPDIITNFKNVWLYILSFKPWYTSTPALRSKDDGGMSVAAIKQFYQDAVKMFEKFDHETVRIQLQHHQALWIINLFSVTCRTTLSSPVLAKIGQTFQLENKMSSFFKF